MGRGRSFESLVESIFERVDRRTKFGQSIDALCNHYITAGDNDGLRRLDTLLQRLFAKGAIDRMTAPPKLTKWFVEERRKRGEKLGDCDLCGTTLSRKMHRIGLEYALEDGTRVMTGERGQGEVPLLRAGSVCMSVLSRFLHALEHNEVDAFVPEEAERKNRETARRRAHGYARKGFDPEVMLRLRERGRNAQLFARLSEVLEYGPAIKEGERSVARYLIDPARTRDMFHWMRQQLREGRLHEVQDVEEAVLRWQYGFALSSDDVADVVLYAFERRPLHAAGVAGNMVRDLEYLQELPRNHWLRQEYDVHFSEEVPVDLQFGGKERKLTVSQMLPLRFMTLAQAVALHNIVPWIEEVREVHNRRIAQQYGPSLLPLERIISPIFEAEKNAYHDQKSQGIKQPAMRVRKDEYFAFKRYVELSGTGLGSKRRNFLMHVSMASMPGAVKKMFTFARRIQLLEELSEEEVQRRYGPDNGIWKTQFTPIVRADARHLVVGKQGRKMNAGIPVAVALDKIANTYVPSQKLGSNDDKARARAAHMTLNRFREYQSGKVKELLDEARFGIVRWSALQPHAKWRNNELSRLYGVVTDAVPVDTEVMNAFSWLREHMGLEVLNAKVNLEAIVRAKYVLPDHGKAVDAIVQTLRTAKIWEEVDAKEKRAQLEQALLFAQSNKESSFYQVRAQGDELVLAEVKNPCTQYKKYLAGGMQVMSPTEVREFFSQTQIMCPAQDVVVKDKYAVLRNMDWQHAVVPRSETHALEQIMGNLFDDARREKMFLSENIVQYLDGLLVKVDECKRQVAENRQAVDALVAKAHLPYKTFDALIEDLASHAQDNYSSTFTFQYCTRWVSLPTVRIGSEHVVNTRTASDLRTRWMSPVALFDLNSFTSLISFLQECHPFRPNYEYMVAGSSGQFRQDGVYKVQVVIDKGKWYMEKVPFDKKSELETLGFRARKVTVGKGEKTQQVWGMFQDNVPGERVIEITNKLSGVGVDYRLRLL